MLVDSALRVLLRAGHCLTKASWFGRRRERFGVHALALTPQGKVILLKLRHARGWRLPGGGRREKEAPREAVLRELREEIGMISYGTINVACELAEDVGPTRDLVSLFIVRDVEYRLRWSWEVEDVMEAALDALPNDFSPRMAHSLRALRPKL